MSKNQKNESESESENEINPEPEKTKTMGRLIRIHIRSFFDNIYIPFKFFNNEEWVLEEILDKNKDVLFYHEDYISEANKKIFENIYSKFRNFLFEIFSTGTTFCNFLKKWTDMSDQKWKNNNTVSYLRKILSDEKYEYISPIHVTNLYFDISKKNKGNVDVIKKELENQLNKINLQTKKETKKFKNTYHKLLTAYVINYPINIHDCRQYSIDFLNLVYVEICKFIDTLLDMHVYGFHPIIEDVVEDYTPFDFMYQYDKEDHDDREILVV